MKVFKVDELNVLWDIIKNALSGKISTIRAGTVTTGNSGTNAAVDITKSGTAAVINFTIPAGVKGDTGAKGTTGTRGSRWSAGTAITGTSTTAAVFATGITDALVNDMYLNTSTGYVYRCTTAGNASTAKWVYTGSIKGVKGDTGAKGTTGTRGSRWSAGTAITGTSTTAAVFATGITDALANDMYLNTNTGYVYRCTVAGNASTAKWVYVGSINGNITDAQISSIFTSVFTKTT